MGHTKGQQKHAHRGRRLRTQPSVRQIGLRGHQTCQHLDPTDATFEFALKYSRRKKRVQWEGRSHKILARIEAE